MKFESICAPDVTDVQIAKALAAHVTAICNAPDVEMVRGLGTDEVTDYTNEAFVAGGMRFDLMLDTAGNRSLSDSRNVVVPDGTFVSCAGGGSAMTWTLDDISFPATALPKQHSWGATYRRRIAKAPNCDHQIIKIERLSQDRRNACRRG